MDTLAELSVQFLVYCSIFFICKLGNVLQAEEDRYGGIFEERGVKAFTSVCQRFLIDGTQRIGKYISQKVYILHRIISTLAKRVLIFY